MLLFRPLEYDISIWEVPFVVSSHYYRHLSIVMCDYCFKMFLNEIFASQALHLRLQLNGFIKCLNLEIQIPCITFRCYPESFGILIQRLEGEWRSLSHFLRKHLLKVTEQVCGEKKKTNTPNYCGLYLPSPSCLLSIVLSLNFLLLKCQNGFIIFYGTLIQHQDLLLLPACWPLLPTEKPRISNNLVASPAERCVDPRKAPQVPLFAVEVRAGKSCNRTWRIGLLKKKIKKIKKRLTWTKSIKVCVWRQNKLEARCWTYV